MARKADCVWTDGSDQDFISRGIESTYRTDNLRFSQLAPIGMFDEKNTRSNLPAQIDLYHTNGGDYKFLFIAKGGGSANKTFLHQGTPSLLKEELLLEYLDERIAALGTAACPPYHLAIVIGGTSAESNLKTVKLASARYLDCLPTKGSEMGHAIRCPEIEEKFLNLPKKEVSVLSLVVNIFVWMFVSFACPVMGQAFRSVLELVVLLIDRPTGKLLKMEFLLSNLKKTRPSFYQRLKRTPMM